MAKNLYPTFNLPPLVAPRTTTEQKKYPSSVHFDFAAGDFVRDGAGRIQTCDGHVAWVEWCLKQLVTERYTRLAYGKNIGVEIESAIKNNTDPEAAQLDIERTITEALLVNPATEYVRDFEFTAEGDRLYVTFIAKGREWENEEPLRLVL